jgi:hypothetical protein
MMLVSQLSDNYIVNVSIRVHDVSDAGIGSVMRVSSVGIGRRKKHVTFNICVESLNASPHELDLKAPIVEEGDHFADDDVDYLRVVIRGRSVAIRAIIFMQLE